MTDARILYLDTGVLRVLWKLHLKDWIKDDDERLVRAKLLREILAVAKQKNQVRAITSPIAVMEMVQFDQSKHYAKSRMGGGDDPMDVLNDWYRLSDRWQKSGPLLGEVLQSARNDLEVWSGSEDFGLVEILHGPWANAGLLNEIPQLLALSLRLALTTPIDSDDCFHVAYLLRYADAIITSDKGLKGSLELALEKGPVRTQLDAEYQTIFGTELPDRSPDAFLYPEDLKRLGKWAETE